MGNLIILIISSFLAVSYISTKEIIIKRIPKINNYLKYVVPLLFGGLFYFYQRSNYFNLIFAENIKDLIPLVVLTSLLFIGLTNFFIKNKERKLFISIYYMLVLIYLLAKINTLTNYIDIYKFSFHSFLFIVILITSLFYQLAYLVSFNYHEFIKSFKDVNKLLEIITSLAITIISIITINYFLIPNVIVKYYLPINYKLVKTFYNQSFFLVSILLMPVLVFYLRKIITKENAHTIQIILISLIIANYLLVNKNIFSGPFSLISITFLSLIIYFISLHYDAFKKNEVPTYLLLFSYLISVLLFNYKTSEAINNFPILLLMIALISMSFINIKKLDLSIANILLSIILITIYFIIAILINSFTLYDQKSLDLLYLNRLYAEYPDYPIINFNDKVIIKNFLTGENYKTKLVVKGRPYYLYLIYSFSIYFIYLSLYLGLVIIIRAYLSLIKFNDRLIKSLFNKEKVRYDNNIKINYELMPSIKINKLNKKYESNTPLILKELDLNLRGNKIIGLLGNNGAGKSTLIKVLAQTISPTSGEVKISGYDLLKNPSECKKLIRYLSDVPKINPYLTGFEYLNIIVKANDPKRNDYLNDLNYYAKLLDLSKDLTKLVASYSFGMKQKIVLIASLLIKPKILILDEPFTGLDPYTTHTLIKVLKSYTDKGNMVIFSSHIIEIVNELADEIYFLYAGQIINDNELKPYRKSDQALEEQIIKLINAAVLAEDR